MKFSLPSLRTSQARFLLFNLWLIMFVVYVAFFLGLGAYNSKVGFEQGSDAAWKIAYIQLPIISAFAGFWFTPSIGQQKYERDDPVVDPHRVYAMFALTVTVHLILVFYLLFGVLLVDWGFPDRGESFSNRVDTGARIMVFLSSLAVLPVGYVLRVEHPIPIAAAPDGLSAPATAAQLPTGEPSLPSSVRERPKGRLK
jgi:hypothetical protein